ncbi:hypothetical protein LTR37_021277 [Vermiconidia calcicola]|uniref:Uncharacterized protein n=1 Tax=Vermiconidia calcicola TaxID=1690605 RepID=A0ACC3MAT5_9PEZI|nr:hypothetical protein LTR37_021277 [Vermiconidia calcicola]
MASTLDNVGVLPVPDTEKESVSNKAEGKSIPQAQHATTSVTRDGDSPIPTEEPQTSVASPTVVSLQRAQTQSSAASKPSESGSIADTAQPMAPLTRITFQESVASEGSQGHTQNSKGATAASHVGTCGRCKQPIAASSPKVRCLVCCTGSKPNVIARVCVNCYHTGAYDSGHVHDKTLCVSDSDIVVTDPKIPGSIWTVRRSVRQKFWYEHRQTGFKTHIRPMTAVCELPSGWAQVRDSMGKVCYRDATGQLFGQHPNGLPPGWREAKDPDGKAFYVHDALRLASWIRPGQQPSIPSQTLAGPQTHSGGAQTHPAQRPAFFPRPSIGGSQPATISTAKPQTNSAAPSPNVVVKPQVAGEVVEGTRPSQQVTLGTATEATVNLVDPTHGSIVRGTKIAAHITGQSVKGTVNAIKHNKPLQDFAKGTGMALANKKIKKAWCKAAREVDAQDSRSYEVKVNHNVPQGQNLVLEEKDERYSGEYVAEYEDGTIAEFSSDGKPLRIIQQPPPTSSMVASPTAQQRPQIVRPATTANITFQQRPTVGRQVSVQMPIRRPVPQVRSQQTAQIQQQQAQVQAQQRKQQLQRQQQQLQIQTQWQQLQQQALREQPMNSRHYSTGGPLVPRQQLVSSDSYGQSGSYTCDAQAEYGNGDQQTFFEPHGNDFPTQGQGIRNTQDQDMVNTQNQDLLIDQSKDITTYQSQVSHGDQSLMANVDQTQNIYVDQRSTMFVDYSQSGFIAQDQSYSMQMDATAGDSGYTDQGADFGGDQFYVHTTAVDYQRVDMTEMQGDYGGGFDVSDVDCISFDMDSSTLGGDFGDFGMC